MSIDHFAVMNFVVFAYCLFHIDLFDQIDVFARSTEAATVEEAADDR